MGALIERAAALAERAARERVRAIATQWRAEVPGAQVSESGDSVVLEARGLRQLWLIDPMLRFAGSLAR